jgi:hypothetical protein
MVPHAVVLENSSRKMSRSRRNPHCKAKDIESHSGPWSSFRLGELRADLSTAMLAVNVTAIGAVKVLRERAFFRPPRLGIGLLL